MPNEHQEYTEYAALGDNSITAILDSPVTAIQQRRTSPIERRAARMQRDAQYAKLVEENLMIMSAYFGGHLSYKKLQQAMSRDDFASLFADTLDRKLVMEYERYETAYDTFLWTETVRDFRTIERFQRQNQAPGLNEVAESEGYDYASLGIGSYTFSVAKYGRAYRLTFEMMVNDDLGFFRNLPVIMAQDARMSEQEFATGLYAANATLFSGGNGNTDTAALSLSAVESAVNQMAGLTDEDGKPVMNDLAYLVVPPGLKLTALKIATNVTPNNFSDVNIIATQGIEVVVDPFLPIVDGTSGTTGWYLFARPSQRQYAAEVAFMTGHEAPQMFIKDADASAVGGRALLPRANFDDDSVSYKVRHVYGGSHANAINGYLFAFFSDGTA